MRLVFTDARVWRYVITAVSKIIGEGVFKAGPEGFKLRAMDPSRIVMVDLNFPPEVFEEYHVDEETTLGVNIEDLTKVLRRAGKDDKLVLEAEEGRLKVGFLGKGERIFKLPLLSLEYSELPEPRIELKARARMISTVFKDLVKDLEPIGDLATFEIDGEKVVARASSDVGEAEIELSTESGNLLEVEAEEPQRSSYSLSYFSDIVSAAQAADSVELSLSTDMPCRLEYSLPQGAKLAFYIAPRVE